MSRRLYTGLGLGSRRFAGANSGPVDPYFESVVSLNHFDGVTGETSLVDQIADAVWTVYGNAQLSTANQRVGSASLRLDGSGDFVTLTGPGLVVEVGDFTLEWSHYGDAVTNCLFYGGWGTAPWYFYNGQIHYSGGSMPITGIGSAVWNDCAISRVGSTLYFFVGGIMMASKSGVSVGFGMSLNVGRYGPNNNLFFNGYVDELRLTHGVGRYTENYTPVLPFSG